jgi:hypothetical protein
MKARFNFALMLFDVKTHPSIHSIVSPAPSPLPSISPSFFPSWTLQPLASKIFKKKKPAARNRSTDRPAGGRASGSRGKEGKWEQVKKEEVVEREMETFQFVFPF